jgi:ribosome maturation factor RimP
MANVVDIVTTSLAEKLADQGFDLWDVIYEPQDGDMMLRVLVDRAEGAINMDDLVMLTEFIGETLDAISPDPFPAAYMLDISSPGAERELKRPHDYEWAVNQFVQVQLKTPLDGQMALTVELTAVTAEALTLAVTVKGKRTMMTVPFTDIKTTHLTISQDRVLTTAEDFAWALNKLVQVTTYQKIDGQKEFAGELTAVSDNELVLTLADEQTVTVPRSAIAKARQSNTIDW